DFDPKARLFTDTQVRPIILTCAASPADRRSALENFADVVVAGEEDVDMRVAIDALAKRGLRHVECEGGPHLLGWLIAAGLLDELCLTVAPVIAGGMAGRVGCFAIRVDRYSGGRVQHAAAPIGYGPQDLRSAYALPSAPAGADMTVAIVDAYDDPRAEQDLATYRAQFGLPACTSTGGCFRKVDQSGGHAFPAPDPGWAQEISLDLDMVSAVCPACTILLVEATSSSQANLGVAVDTAVRLGADAVSNSYGGPDASDRSYGRYYHHAGVAITASTGDNGY